MCNGQPENQSQAPQPAFWQQYKDALTNIREKDIKVALKNIQEKNIKPPFKNMWKKDMPCFFYCPPTCPLHRSQKRIQQEEERQLKNLLVAFDRYEKAKSSEEARAGYEKASLSHRRDDYRKIHFFGSEEAKELEQSLLLSYPKLLHRELICSCVGQWVLAKTTETSVLGNDLRDASHDHQRVLGDIFEISELGDIFGHITDSHCRNDCDKGRYMGDLKVEHFMLSQINMEGIKRTASVVHWLKDDDGNTFPQMLQWDNGEVWTRKRPELEKLNGHWHRASLNGECIPMSVPPQSQINIGPNGELEIILSPDGENAEKLWVVMEHDLEHPGSQRLRWSNGQVWYPGQVSEEIEIQCGECAPAIVSPSDSVEEVDCSMISAAIVESESSRCAVAVGGIGVENQSVLDKPRAALSAFQDHADAAEIVLAHIQNRNREIQELLSSVEEVEEVDCSMVSAAIVEDYFDEEDHFDEEGNLKGWMAL